MGAKDYSIIVDKKQNVVRVHGKGVLDVPIANEVISRARITAAEHGLGILYDFREVELAASMADMFRFPRDLGVFLDPQTRGIKVAVLVPEERDFRAWSFYETTARNSGLRLRIFREETVALTWLKDEEAE